MKRLIPGLLSALIVIVTWSTKADNAIKNLTISIICLIMSLGYFAIIRIRRTNSAAYFVLIIATTLFFLINVLNVVLSIGVSTLVLWISYSLIIFIGLAVGAKFEHID